MRSKWVILAVVALVQNMAFASLFTDDFETYDNGTFPTAADSWVLSSNPASVISTATASSGVKSLDLRSGTLFHEFTEQTSGIVQLSFDITASANNARSLNVNLTDSSNNYATYFYLYSDGNMVYYDGGWKTVAAYAADTWYKVTMDIDLDNSTYSIAVNDDVKVTGAKFRSAVTSVSRVRMNNYSGTVTGYVDNLSVARVVPEPMTMALVGLGWALAFLRSKRK